IVMAEPADVMEDGGAAGLDAAMIGIDRLVLTDRGILEFSGFLLPGEELDIVTKGALVALQGEHVIGSSVDDLPGDLTLAAYGIDGDDGALDGQHIQEFGNGDDLVRLLRHLDLSQHQALTGGEG